tara:strand:- start:140 stop:610 length:471 start_codon:yes stop_codon:yes gene_type:complete
VANFYTGKDGELYIGSSTTAAGQIKSWSYSMTMAVIETTSLGDTDRLITDGLRSYSGSATAAYYTAAAGGTSNVKDLLTAAMKPGSSAGDGVNDASDKVVLKLRYSEGTGNTNARDIQFEVYITNVTMGSSTGEISNVEFTWEANGAPYTNTTMIN